jgi:hypothetical protein
MNNRHEGGERCDIAVAFEKSNVVIKISEKILHG